MLKRSFAEFHAQKNLPEKQKELLLKLRQPLKAIEYAFFLHFCIVLLQLYEAYYVGGFSGA
jgi:rRNA-processing arch domain